MGQKERATVKSRLYQSSKDDRQPSSPVSGCYGTGGSAVFEEGQTVH